MSVLYPDVPDTPGVPTVLRNKFPVDEAAYSPPLDHTPATGPDDWGVYDRSGAKLVDPDSVVSLEYHGEHRISDYQIEGGGFQSYNKVGMPFDVHLLLTKGGSVTDRAAFMLALEQLRAGLALYDVVTPERVYTGVNVVRLSQGRTATAGAGMATMEVGLEEVRETVAVAYSTAPPATDTPAPATDAPGGGTSSDPPVAKPATGDVQPKAVANGTTAGAKAGTSAGNVVGKAFSPGATVGAAAARMVNQGSVQSRAAGEKITRLADGTVIFDFKGGQ